MFTAVAECGTVCPIPRELTSYEKMKDKVTAQRLYHLDWLRVIAIGLLILYHTGMVYVPEWGFHYKAETGYFWLQNLMLMLSPWRMGLLWFISGVALRFMWHKFNLINLLWIRSRTLLLPLLIGVLFVVPPQLYIEMKQAGDMPLSFLSFLKAFYFEPGHYFDDYQSGIWPGFDVNHLWFLRSLWQFGMLLLLLSPMLLNRYFQVIYLRRLNNIPVLCLISVAVVLVIETQSAGEQKRELYGGFFLLAGFLIGNSNDFWENLNRNTKWLVSAAFISLLCLQLVFVLIRQTDASEGHKIADGLALVIYSSAKVFPVLAALALGGKYLNRKSDGVARLNQWVFPVYVLHQTIIIAAAYIISPLNLTTAFKVTLTLALTFGLCGAAVKLMRHVTGAGVFLGRNSPDIAHWSNSGYWRWFVTLLCLPLALELVL